MLSNKQFRFPEIDQLPADLKTIFDDGGNGMSDAYINLKWTLADPRFIQTGGYPNPVQGDDSIAERISELLGKGSAADWNMILEIADNKCTDMMWGDAGRLHFFAYRPDVQRKDFHDVWMEFQCH